MAITYNITTDFGAKDSLPTGDSGKIIKGVDFTTEFDNIQTAFALAAPAASPTFTGTVTIPTVAVTNITFGGVAITATAAELNKMDGVTATTAELNILDGVTATTAALNYVDGVTSNIQTQLDAITGVTGGISGTYAPIASPTFTGTVTAPNLNIGNWQIALDGSDLRFIYNGTDVFKITTAGAIIAKDDVTAFGAP